MNRNLFYWILGKAGVGLGEVIPRWLRVVRFILMPLNTARWMLIEKEGYQLATNTWLIHGVRYTDEYFKTLSTPNGMWFRVIGKEGEIITIESKPGREDPAP